MAPTSRTRGEGGRLPAKCASRRKMRAPGGLHASLVGRSAGERRGTFRRRYGGAALLFAFRLSRVGDGSAAHEAGAPDGLANVTNDVLCYPSRSLSYGKGARCGRLGHEPRTRQIDPEKLFAVAVAGQFTTTPRIRYGRSAGFNRSRMKLRGRVGKARIRKPDETGAECPTHRNRLKTQISGRGRHAKCSRPRRPPCRGGKRPPRGAC